MAQLIVSIAVSEDDGEVDRSGTSYPPTATGPTVSTIAGGIDARKRFEGATYANKVVLLRFDTSAVPDNATVTGATLRIRIGPTTNANSRNLNCDWLADGAIGTGDYADLVGTDGFTITIASLTINSLNDVALSTPSNVNKTGYTKLRLGISGSTPVGTNEVPIDSWDHATNPEPQLVVDYLLPAGVRPDYNNFPPVRV